MIATLKITMLKWKRCKFDNWRWLSVLFCCERKWTKNNSVFLLKSVVILIYEVRCAHNKGDVVNFTTVACRISLWLKWYKNYKNRLQLAKVIVENIMSRFFMVHCVIAQLRYIIRHWIFPIRPIGLFQTIIFALCCVLEAEGGISVERSLQKNERCVSYL